MTAIMRNNAVRPSGAQIGQATLRGGGGDGRGFGATNRPGKVRAKVRYSADPAAELMPAAEFLGAEPDFAAILEDFGDSPFNPQRRRVLGRLAGVFAMDYQGARSQERAFLRRLLMARNAREGYVANRALHLCYAQHALRRTLALGVAEARWGEGPIQGFLGAVQARVASTTLSLLGAETRDAIWSLLTMAGHDQGKPLPGADPVIERALILKALGARRYRLGPWRADGNDAVSEIKIFAEQIRGCWRATLAARTTLFAGDPERVAPGLESLVGGARAVYIARGEVDPIFAWREHGENREEAPEGVEAFADIYEALPELDRRPVLDRPRLHQALAEARALATGPGGPLTLRQVAALADYMVGVDLTETKQGLKEEAFEIVRDQGFDIIGVQSLEAIREDARGIYKFDAAQGFGLLLSRYTGAVYVRRVFSDLLTAGLDPIPQIISALRKGMAVPIIVRELRFPVVRAWAALSERREADQQLFSLRRPAENQEIELPAQQLVLPQLPPDFGRQARADTFLAPAALDLLAPPFGIPFPEIGIRDGL